MIIVIAYKGSLHSPDICLLTFFLEVWHTFRGGVQDLWHFVTGGEGGVKNPQKKRDILYGRPPTEKNVVFLSENLNAIVPKSRSQWVLVQEPHWESRTSSKTSLRIKNIVRNLIKNQDLGPDLIEILIEILYEDFFSLRISMRISLRSCPRSWFIYLFIYLLRTFASAMHN